MGKELDVAEKEELRETDQNVQLKSHCVERQPSK